MSFTVHVISIKPLGEGFVTPSLTGPSRSLKMYHDNIKGQFKESITCPCSLHAEYKLV